MRVIGELSLQVPLESFSSELDAYLAILRNWLLEIITDHYADFVSLSSRLVSVDTAVLRMQKPLLEISGCVWTSDRSHAPHASSAVWPRACSLLCRDLLALLSRCVLTGQAAGSQKQCVWGFGLLAGTA